MALLRHLYGLPYRADLPEWHDGLSLLPHALVYVTAEKCQIKELQITACATMSDIICINSNRKVKIESSLRLVQFPDFLAALRTIITGTPSNDTLGRDLLITYCVGQRRMTQLLKNEQFTAMLAEIPELGTELLAHTYAGQDFTEDYDPCKVDADADEEDEFEWCEHCQDNRKVVCSGCGS
jgi:hypothetical protein